MVNYHSISGHFTEKEKSFLSRFNVKINEGYDGFGIMENETYFEIIDRIKGIKQFRDAINYVEFTMDELNSANSYMYRGGGFRNIYPIEDLMYESFGGSCPKCFQIIGNQISPFAFHKEPKAPKGSLFFTVNWIHNYLFTDKHLFEEIVEPWGLKSIPVLIGKRKAVAENIVQVVLPFAKSKLHFGSSLFGETFNEKGDVGPDNKPCTECNIVKYNTLQKDFFPDFEKPFDFNIVHTQELFGNYHQIVISKKFADFLVENKFESWDQRSFVPVKDFKKLTYD